MRDTWKEGKKRSNFYVCNSKANVDMKIVNNGTARAVFAIPASPKGLAADVLVAIAETRSFLDEAC
jgi:hypothetical protein